VAPARSVYLACRLRKPRSLLVFCLINLVGSLTRLFHEGSPGRGINAFGTCGSGSPFVKTITNLWSVRIWQRTLVVSWWWRCWTGCNPWVLCDAWDGTPRLAPASAGTPTDLQRSDRIRSPHSSWGFPLSLYVSIYKKRWNCALAHESCTFQQTDDLWCPTRGPLLLLQYVTVTGL
jgi:hypothetical protein